MKEQITLPRFYHNVYFYLAEEAAPDAAAKLADGAKRHLAAIPGIMSFAIGMPAGTNRPVVDDSYGVALLVQFADRSAHDAYQSHPDHHAFLAECSSYWKRVAIYDTISY